LQDPAGELEEAVRGLVGQSGENVLVGLDDGDDAAAVLVGDVAVLSTADFFTPVVDDAYDWGRIAAANALSDIYAMGGRPIIAINLIGWPRDVLPLELMTEVLRGGWRWGRRRAAGDRWSFHRRSRAEVRDGRDGCGRPESVAAQRCRRTWPAADPHQAARVGLLNNRHKQTGEVFAEAVATMTRLNRDAAAAAVATGVRAATDVTGFGLLGHLHKMCRASRWAPSSTAPRCR